MMREIIHLQTLRTGWQCTTPVVPKIDTDYSLNIVPDIHDTTLNSKRAARAIVSLTVIEGSGPTVAHKRLVITAERSGPYLFAKGADPLYFHAQRAHKYQVTIHVDRSDFDPATPAQFDLGMEYMDVMTYDIWRACAILAGLTLFGTAIVLGIVSHVR